ncbi:MAG: penicillin-binding protein [Acidobacteriota bacterium]
MQPPSSTPHAARDLWSHGRLAVVCLVGGLWLLAAAVRLWHLQVDRHEHYVQAAEEQQQLVVTLDAPRGTIFDARGRSLAVSVEAASVAADPSLVDDPEALADALSEVLGAPRDELLAKLRLERRFTWLERKINPPAARRVRELAAVEPGLIVLSESKRYYPLGDLAGPVLGYVGIDNQGLGGLEYRYDDEVSTEAGQRTILRDGLAGRVFYPELPSDAARPGDDLYLTLDATIQNIVERELRAAVEAAGAKGGSAVVLDPNTGALMAMASVPGFDPNHYAKTPAARRGNPTLAGSFEPGSTFKMVTLAAALEASAVDPQEIFDCGNGSIVLRGRRIRDHKPFDRLTAREIMANSSNIGAIRLAGRAGTERFYSTIRAFGFGTPTGIDLPSEAAGLVRPLKRWAALSPAYISFGQGIAVTNLQMANAFAAIANDGRLLRPYVVASVGTPPAPGSAQREVVGLPISPSTARQVASYLETVVLDGTGKAAQLGGWRAAGKTGTAEKAIDGRYVPGRYVASFVGFAPLDDPVLVMAVSLDEPWPRYHGGEVAAPVFGAVAEQALLYLGVPPDAPRPPDPENPTIDTAPLDSIRLAAAPAAPPSAAPVVRLDLESRLAQTPDGAVPDLAGLTAREALQIAGALGFDLRFDGHGAVTRQAPDAGTPLERTDGVVRLWLEASS